MAAPRIVEVLWEDACSSDPWSRATDPLDACLSLTVGIQMGRDEKGIYLAGAVNNSGQRASRWRIPAGMIRRVRVLGTLSELP